MASDKDHSALAEQFAAAELEEFGRLLDAMEGGRVALNARQYRKAAVYALKTLRGFFEADAVIDACAVSPALTELRANVEAERAAAQGRPSGDVPGPTNLSALVSRRL